MKKQILLLFGLMVISLTSLKAQDFNVDDIYYTITGATTVEVSSHPSCYSDSVVIPETVVFSDTTYTVTSIGIQSFSNCIGLTSIIIPNTVTIIKNGAFNQCIGLTSIDIPPSVTAIVDYAFNQCTYLASVTMTDSVVQLGQGAFQECISLTSITLPSFLPSIAVNLFSGCTNLSQITIPDSVTGIGAFAFADCISLLNVTIPELVAYIDEYAFSECTGLQSVTVYVPTPLMIYESVFYQVNQSNVDLYVPAGSVNAYSNAPVWQDFNPINAILSIEEQDLNSLVSLYPNPAQHSLHINVTKGSIEGVSVYSVLGKRLITSKKRELDVSNLPKGIYLVNVETNLGIINKRIIKR